MVGFPQNSVKIHNKDYKIVMQAFDLFLLIDESFAPIKLSMTTSCTRERAKHWFEKSDKRKKNGEKNKKL